jgi:hypothetical protein
MRLFRKVGEENERPKFKKVIQRPGIEPGTSAVLKPRHNQLDHLCDVTKEGPGNIFFLFLLKHQKVSNCNEAIDEARFVPKFQITLLKPSKVTAQEVFVVSIH